jgi:hypothetical protein
MEKIHGFEKSMEHFMKKKYYWLKNFFTKIFVLWSQFFQKKKQKEKI